MAGRRRRVARAEAARVRRPPDRVRPRVGIAGIGPYAALDPPWSYEDGVGAAAGCWNIDAGYGDAAMMSGEDSSAGTGMSMPSRRAWSCSARRLPPTSRVVSIRSIRSSPSSRSIISPRIRPISSRSAATSSLSPRSSSRRR